MPFSVRLDPDTIAIIRQLSAATGRTRSDIVREAVSRYGSEQVAQTPQGLSAFDRLRPYAGIVSTGGAQYSRGTHAKYAEQLRRKHRARRPD
jgi:Ribbon-helix-helix protein, copG family